MRWVSGAIFIQGAKEGDALAMASERPAHMVKVDGFYIDETEVTNAQFKSFVEETGYVTTAERPIDWEMMKQELPPNTPRPHDSILQPGSMVFNEHIGQVTNMSDVSQWWRWQLGASWQQPQGPGSFIEGKEAYPVVHISYEDAVAYCAWANRRLPTEAEWELAAHGKDLEALFTWGDDKNLLTRQANTWQGRFPEKNEMLDGFAAAAPVKSFPENTNGIYDMAGNVWEWTQDWYHATYYASLSRQELTVNPKGAVESYNPQNPYQPEKIIKGGSFLCHESYCASFRISARMGMSLDSSTDHVGFRTVVTPAMIAK
jgi:formylglycine-generating enzyme required for sulfatase activity